MIWVRRLAPVVILGLIALAWYVYDTVSTREIDRTTDEYALITAQTWIATARFRQQPERFMAWRDSLLAAQSLSLETLRKYFDIYQNQPEEYYEFVHKVQVYVDSLFLIEDSLRTATEQDSSAADTAVSP